MVYCTTSPFDPAVFFDLPGTRPHSFPKSGNIGIRLCPLVVIPESDLTHKHYRMLLQRNKPFSQIF